MYIISQAYLMITVSNLDGNSSHCAYNTPDYDDALTPRHQPQMSHTSNNLYKDFKDKLHEGIKKKIFETKNKKLKRKISDNSISSLRESFISIKVCKSNHK